MSYKIGSFNTLHMDFTSTEKRKINFKQLAQIIRDEQYDIVALQEIRNENVIKECLIPALEMKWNYIWKFSDSIFQKASEGYVFIFRNSGFPSLVLETAIITLWFPAPRPAFPLIFAPK